jgi:hypothetical protein
MSDREPHTYEAPAAGSDAAGLEDYIVEIAGGNRVGTVVTTIEEEGRRWIVIEQGAPPFKRDRRVVPFQEISSVDHDALVVTLRDEGRLAEAPARLKSDEVEEGGAPARRATRPVDPPRSVPTGDVAGPADRTGTLFVALAAFAVGLLALLALIVGLSRRGLDDGPVWAFAVVPALLLVTSAFFAYRLWRNPYSDPRR